MSSSNALNSAVPLFSSTQYQEWAQKMGDYLISQQLWLQVEAVVNGGLAWLVTANPAAPMQQEFQAQLDWDCDDLQTKGILGLQLSPNLCTHIGATACW